MAVTYATNLVHGPRSSLAWPSRCTANEADDLPLAWPSRCVAIAIHSHLLLPPVWPPQCATIIVRSRLLLLWCIRYPTQSPMANKSTIVATRNDAIAVAAQPLSLPQDYRSLKIAVLNNTIVDNKISTIIH